MVPATVSVHRLSFDDVVRMYEVGVLDELERLELVDGVLVEMSPIGPAHDGAVGWLTRRFVPAVPPGLEVRIQSTFRIPRGFLLPDLMLIEPSRTRHPETAFLVIEVAQTSQARDREKALDYARAGVPDCWIVDLSARTVTIHRDPSPAGYRQQQTFGDGETITPLAAEAPAVAVAELMG